MKELASITEETTHLIDTATRLQVSIDNALMSSTFTFFHPFTYLVHGTEQFAYWSAITAGPMKPHQMNPDHQLGWIMVKGTT